VKKNANFTHEKNIENLWLKWMHQF